jgi:uncharacterized protein (TIGR00369 family)
VDDALPSGFAELIGVEWIDLGPEQARARITVTQSHMQPYGVVHGGVYAGLAESVCSAATYMAVKDEGKVAMGQSNDTSFLRPISDGHINAVARRRHGGSTTWLWDVEILDDSERLCALVRMTVAVRPRRA